MGPENHPSFYDPGGSERRIEQSKTYALWAIAAELHRMNMPNATIGDNVWVKWDGEIVECEITDISCYDDGLRYDVSIQGDQTVTISQKDILKIH